LSPPLALGIEQLHALHDNRATHQYEALK